MAAVFGSPDIQEPRKWRLFLFLMARYFTLFTSLFGIAQIIESILHSRDWPIPLRIAMTIPSVICYIVAFVTVYSCELSDTSSDTVAAYHELRHDCRGGDTQPTLATLRLPASKGT